jgi:hypothetical protein
MMLQSGGSQCKTGFSDLHNVAIKFSTWLGISQKAVVHYAYARITRGHPA